MALNVLIVDDSGIIRAMIEKTLRMTQTPLGEVFQAANGAEALKLLGGQWVDLIFCDLHMPEMTGDELIRRMKADPLLKSIPVVVVSSDGSQERLEELKALGIRNYLRKPFAPEEMSAITQEILGVATHE